MASIDLVVNTLEAIGVKGFQSESKSEADSPLARNSFIQRAVTLRFTVKSCTVGTNRLLITLVTNYLQTIWISTKSCSYMNNAHEGFIV